VSAGKVLVVDDEPQIRRVMRVILAGENYEVLEARSGEAALLRFREFLPDLVLLDLNMPGMSGLEACRSIQLRRSPAAAASGPKTFVAGDLEIDFEARKIRSGKKNVRLTPKEFDLLRYLVSHAGKPVPHRELLQAVWGPDYGDQTDYLRVFITHLRKKIEPNPAKPQYILTDPWLGYRFETGSET
jgi:two-component system KDP operon response regulator KdpE